MHFANPYFEQIYQNIEYSVYEYMQIQFLYHISRI
jgi:hypothetical protein